MRFKVYFQMSINFYNAKIEEEKHLITLGHHRALNCFVLRFLSLFIDGEHSFIYDPSCCRNVRALAFLSVWPLIRRRIDYDPGRGQVTSFSWPTGVRWIFFWPLVHASNSKKEKSEQLILFYSIFSKFD